MNSADKIRENAKKYLDVAYRFKAFGTEYVVLPSRFYNEVRRIPESRGSLMAFFREAFNAHWAGMPSHTQEMMRAVSVDLSRHIPSIINQRQRDCAKACEDNIGDCPEWKEITVYKALQSIAVTINASALVGSELGHDKRWIRHIQRLTPGVAFPTMILSYVPDFLKLLLKPLLFIPIRYTRFVLKRLLVPVLKQDLAELSGLGKPTIVNDKLALSSFLLNRYSSSAGTLRDPISQIASDILDISLESTPSTSGTLYWILMELAADPALVKALRDEISAVTKSQGGKLPATHLNELRLMDSVMRESIRVNCFSHIILYRRLLEPFTLTPSWDHKIPTLPAGTTIAVDAHAINFSPELWGPNDPYVFDAYRHFNARKKKGDENKYKFANLGFDSPHWGDGTQACPGRMFADNTIKVVLTHLLQNYDWRFRTEKGESRKPEKGQMSNGSMYPNMSAKLMFRNRQKGE
ncbi:cytochrome p450 oxidoreductase [Cladorrhinum samala]|uniref:Cytochrome p450 oxidoreductase n=1 Tax=Cladorrhinum samala TaxID=585594 RepID=A0AAV9HG33_9PEZI|nr:cytochrome p450 oxidoreductase [Cladorrhinum samala]